MEPQAREQGIRWRGHRADEDGGVRGRVCLGPQALHPAGPITNLKLLQKPALAVSSDSCFLFSSKTRFSMSAAFTLVA